MGLVRRRWASRQWYCSHLSQEVVYSLEQVEPMGFVRRCFAIAGTVQRLAGVDWS